MIPLWFVFSVLTGVASNVFNIFSRLLLKGDSDPTVFAWYVGLLRLFVFGTVALITNGHLIITPQSIFLFTLMSLSECVAVYSYMKMHAYSHLSVSTIVSRTRMIWIPLFAYAIIGERLSLLDYTSIIILFIGICIVSAPHKIFVDKGALYANISALAVAINVVLAKTAIDFGTNSAILAVHTLATVFLLPLFMRNTRKRIKTFLSTNLLKKTVVPVFTIVQMYFFIIAIRLGDASKVNAVYQGMLIFSVLAGIFVLKEKDDMFKKIIGAVIALVGVILLGFS